MSYIEIFGTLKDASFGGTNLSSLDYYIYDVKKPLMSKQDINLFDPPDRPGKIMLSKKLTEYELTLNGFIEAENHSDLITKINAISAFLYSDSDQQLIISDEPTKYWNCQYLDYAEVGKKDRYSLVDLIFSCNEYPFGLAVTEDTDTQTGITVIGQTFNITNSGHYFAWPVITITFNDASPPISNTHIYLANNTISGCRIDISKTFEADDELEIDSWNKTIKLNSVLDPSGLGDGGDGKAVFPPLAKGINQFEAGTDDADLDIDIYTTFRKTYLS